MAGVAWGLATPLKVPNKVIHEVLAYRQCKSSSSDIKTYPNKVVFASNEK
jgi:hypothetical protein